MRSIILSAILLTLAAFAAANPIMDQVKRDCSSIIPFFPFFHLTGCLFVGPQFPTTEGGGNGGSKDW